MSAPRSVLVTGGTGSLGREVVRTLLAGPTERIVVYSRGEHRQERMREELAREHGLAAIEERVRFFVGDVRDEARLDIALRGVEAVVHAAALKVVPVAEYNPGEAVQTNVLGTMNVLRATLRSDHVERVVVVSTDKASAPLNLYGATKLCAEKLALAWNAYAAGYGPEYVVVRYGNVAGSRGSVIGRWRALARAGAPLPLTDPRMTRFWITLPEAASLVLHVLAEGPAATVTVPKLPSVRMVELAAAVLRAAGRPEDEIEIVGMRPGEKLHESLISEEEAHAAWDAGDVYLLSGAPPPAATAQTVHTLAGPVQVEREPVRVPAGFRYTSGENSWWLVGDELDRRLAEILTDEEP